MNAELESKLQSAVDQSLLLPAALENIRKLLAGAPSSLYETAVLQLADLAAWEELNDRFFRTLAFGTGGLRGRSIGRVVAPVETGTPAALGRPEFPCSGTNALNYFNISRSTQGLMRYLKKWRAEAGLSGRASVAIAHDSRFFSREFAELTARVASEMGCDAYLFTACRSTPELSFAVRHTGADAGVVVTASHNPSHDNGYKVYFNDGAQVLPPHDKGIITEVNAVVSETFEPVPEAERGTIHPMGAELDAAYIERLKTVVLRPELLSAVPVKIVFTPIHGTGGAIIPKALAAFGLEIDELASQREPDGRFPTVPSPNPENASALKLGIERALETGADLLLGTDPDADRLGAAIRTADGRMEIITGNQIGSMLAYYRAMTLFEKGVLHDGNKSRSVIIKTFVTTDLQKTIAEHFGLRCVETLTGFKYIGRKLGCYEQALPEEIRSKYRTMSEAETRDARLEHSSYYVFGGEESYGYSAADFVRDKDANMAAILFVELAAYVKSTGSTLDVFLDGIYREFGYYLEKNAALVFEGASGADKIAKLARSYAENAPVQLGGSAVTEVRDFASGTFHDVEGEEIPKEKMMMFSLADGSRVAVRPSGTEPKIKYYLFGVQKPDAGKSFDAAELASAKSALHDRLEALWQALEADAQARLSA